MTKKLSLSSCIKSMPLVATSVFLTGLFTICSVVQAAQVRHQVPHEEGEYLKPTGKGWGENDPTGLTAKKAFRFFPRLQGNGISYHGGPVMLNKVNMYYIWYGAWDFNSNDRNYDTTKMILNAFGSYHRRNALLQHQHDLSQFQQSGREWTGGLTPTSITDSRQPGLDADRCRGATYRG